MKKSYTFFEVLIQFTSRPAIRSYILPVFIIVFGALFIILKERESGFADNFADESLTAQAALLVKNNLLSVEFDLMKSEEQIRNAVDKSARLTDQEYEDINFSDKKLQKIYLDYQQEPFFATYLSLYQLLDQKTKLQKKIFFELLENNGTGNIALIHSNELKNLNSNIRSEGKKIEAGMSADAASVQLLAAKSKQIGFNNLMIYVVGALFCFSIWVFLYVKAKQSRESAMQVKTSAAVKENFLANMSHEIRTPLNAILGFTNILRNTKMNEEQKEYVEIIQSSGDNLLSIVNDILDLSKIEAGMLRIDKTPFRISQIISAVEAMLKPKAEEKHLKLVVKVDEEVPDMVSGDAVRLTQILVNLVSNAIKFTQEGGVYLKVAPAKQEDGKLFVEFMVRDTGIGIPEEKQKNIFGRFEQAEASITRRFGGTGLGLAIVKNLIELQNGTIDLYSQEGGGSIFTVIIPYDISTEKFTAAENQIAHFNPTDMKTDIKILIAEDNSMNQRLIKHLMNSWSFNYDLVFNGVQALEALKKQHYDLVLMDIQMPEMDGYTATSHIRNTLKSSIPIIAMTAHAMTGEREKCLSAGMDDYLSKPINEKMLYTLIQKYSNTGNTTAHTEQSSNAEVKMGKVIDLNIINKYSGGDMEFRKEMIKEFINIVPPSINSLETAINQGNYSRIKAIAHDMKTTIHVMGLTMLIGHILQQIEAYAYSNTGLSSINQLFTEVKDVCLTAVQEAGRLVA
jgi:signal transduction histidine kinase/CheY-like chemotaxis protein